MLWLSPSLLYKLPLIRVQGAVSHGIRLTAYHIRGLDRRRRRFACMHDRTICHNTNRSSNKGSASAEIDDCVEAQLTVLLIRGCEKMITYQRCGKLSK